MTTLHWLDLETTGLTPESHRILEVGVISTTEKLNELDRFHKVIRCEPMYLARMDQTVHTMHHNSGLLEAIETGETLSDAFHDLSLYLQSYSPATSYLAGSGIHFDIKFLRYWSAHLLDQVHYRALDITAIRLAHEFQTGVKPTKHIPAHRSIPDCEDAIAEYKTFRVFKGDF